MGDENIWFIGDTAHALAEPAFSYEKRIMSSEFHWHCHALQTLLCAQILVHHAAAVKVFCGHAHFAVNTFSWVDVVTVTDD
jgi:hypothetical protein